MLIIHQLIITGDNKTDKSISFKKGVNFVTGPSNTGKTFIFKCINYMFGSSTTPPLLNEGLGYTDIYLEISLNSVFYTLHRQFTGDKISLYLGVHSNEIETSNPISILDAAHKKNKTNTISYFTLNNCGYNLPIELKKSKDNKKVNFTLNYLKNYLMLNETEIISEDSIIEATQYIEKTTYYSLLKFLLTGIDDSGIKVVQNSQKIIDKSIAKKELLLELIGQAKKEIPKGVDNLDIDQINLQNEQLRSALNEVISSVNNLSEKRVSLINEIKKQENLFQRKKGNYHKFLLLQKQYDSDLERLEFSDESLDYLSQISPFKCQSCGQSTTTITGNEKELFNIAVKEEYEKILHKKKDLTEVITQLMKEINSTEQTLEKSKIELVRIENELNNKLNPKIKDFQIKLNDIFLKKDLYSKLTSLNKLEKKLESLENSMKPVTEDENEQQKINLDFIDIYNDSSFKIYFAQILNDWKIGNNIHSTDINFIKVPIGKGKYKIDFEIGGKKRSNYGKGYRSLIHTAFLISLMNFSIEKELPHPRILLFDSPITTYSGVDSNKTQEIHDKRLTSFYKSLNKYNNSQIIIFENKIVPEEFQDNFNIIKFTRSKEGRYGFY
ncbi:hypothetical protein J1907_09735 [Lysinibacillus sphaericus]|uniref:hypothetical protein n=1 Tax=Lysinibacillus sphaericus TaxID=1421 RepID=UPI00055E9B3B|nr:hypothetical protein [Lysinibacillus sphaericus]QTB24291.1 hypothetical protein J1907_09735 [Lysinibacillus sphaericus]